MKVRDNLKSKGTTGITADAHLSIAPGTRGVPISSRLNATYNGARDTIDLAKSYIALPRSRLDLIGTLGKEIDLQLRSRNLNDFLPAAAFASSGKPMTQLPVTLENGTALLNARVIRQLKRATDFRKRRADALHHGAAQVRPISC